VAGKRTEGTRAAASSSANVACRVPALVCVHELLGGRVGEGVAEGGSGGDAEFGEDVVEIRGDRSRGEEEAGGDLLVGVACRRVGVACRREQGDLALLRREGGQAGVGFGDRDAGGSQLMIRASRPRGCSELVKGSAASASWRRASVVRLLRRRWEP
jgi:hypothetical protein